MSTRIYCYGRIQRNPSITDTIGNQNFVRYRGVPSSGGFRYTSGRRGMHNRAVEHNVAAFSELCCTLAGKACTTKQR